MKTTLLLALALALTQASAAVDRYQVGPGAKATFQAVGKPSLLKIRGEGAKVEGELTLDDGKASGKFDLALDQFGTGIALRDRHMKEKYLETAKFPRATLEVSEVALPAGFKAGQTVKDAAFKGKLTLKGVTKDVSGRLSVEGEKLATVAEFGFSLADYPVGVPSYMGVSVADQVQVAVELPAFERK